MDTPQETKRPELWERLRGMSVPLVQRSGPAEDLRSDWWNARSLEVKLARGTRVHLDPVELDADGVCRGCVHDFQDGQLEVEGLAIGDWIEFGEQNILFARLDD